MKKVFNTRLTGVALALAVSSNAWALTPSDGTPDLYLYIPGSQANDPAFGFMVNNATVANAVCLDNATATGGSSSTTHIYFHTAGAASAAVNDNYSAIYCYTDNTKIPGLTGGIGTTHKSKIWISRRRLGASFVGLDAVDHGTALTYLKDPATANCTAYNGSYSSGGATYQWNYSCTVATAGLAATAATSDVSPDAYIGDNVTPGAVAIDSSTLDNIRVLGGHIIGLPVTLKLRNALQYAEIQTGLIPSTCTVGSEVADCVPSLSKEQLVSLFSGQITDWSQFYVNSSQTLADIVAAGVTAGVSGLSNPLDTTVHICRRENGAGQQVAVLANVLQYPCLGGHGAKLATTSATGDIQYATSLGAVDKCLTDYNNGSNGWFGTTNPSPYPNPPATSVAHGNQWAMSIQTTERNATNGSPYRFIRVNGALPTGEQAYYGHYPIIGSYSLSWKTASVSANQAAALTAIADYSSLPDTIKSRNGTLSNQTFGQAGYIALSDNGYTPSVAWDATNPVYPFSKLNPSTSSPDACAIPYVNPNFGTVELK